MPTFAYTALDARGSKRSGIIEAADSRELTQRLRQQQLYVSTIRVVGPLAAPNQDGSRRTRGRTWTLGKVVRPRELAGFTRQLATLLRAGLPLMKSLEVLARQERNRRFREVVETLAQTIRSGSALSDALRQQTRIFDRLFVNMVKAGEASGALEAVLDRLARFQEKSLQLRGKVQAALMYPAIVMLVALAILAALLLLVVPKFQQIFADLLKGAPLPPLTRGVLAVSEVVRHHFLATAGTLLLLGVAFQLFRRTTRGARVVDTLLLRVPLFGGLLSRALIARFARTLGTLLASGVPILQALVITRDTCANARVAAAVTLVHDRVKEGAPVARPIEGSGVFPPLVASMVEVGEHSGQLPAMLNKVADIYEEEVDNAVAGLSSLIEPVMILFLAVVVGTIVIALFLPIIRIVQLLT